MRPVQKRAISPFPPPATRARSNESSVSSFPERVQVTLSPEQRDGMLTLANRLPHANDAELVSKILSRGIQVMLQETQDEDAPVPASVVTPRFAAKKRSAVIVENYLGFSLEERLRRKLENFLNAHPDALPEEDAYALLLELGLDRGEELSAGYALNEAKKAER